MKLPTINRPVISSPKLPLRPPAPLPARLAAITRPDMAQIAPGKYAPTSDKVPEMTLCTWQKAGDNHYHPVPVAERWVQVDRFLLRSLGFQGPRPRADVLLRLGRAGFIEIIRATPGCHMLNLDSWFNHLRRCAEDPFFWEDEARIDEYRKSL
jgi:hypothetical protein